MDGRWTGCGRAGAAEIAWEEARDGGARANVRIRWQAGCGRAGAAEIAWAWEEARDGGARAGSGGRCGRAGAAEIAWERLEREERERMSGSGGRAVDGLWTGGSCRNSMGGG